MDDVADKLWATQDDLTEALSAINEIMEMDKPSQVEIRDWCNKNLTLVKRYGFQRWTIEFF